MATAQPWGRAAEPASSDPPRSPGTSIEPFVFTGTTREYFGIWIVNILLTIVTLGIHSATSSASTRCASSAGRRHRRADHTDRRRHRRGCRGHPRAGVGTGRPVLFARQEAESDRASVELMLEAGKDPAAIVGFLEIVRDRLEKGGGTDFFSTHPAMQQRIEAAKVRQAIGHSPPFAALSRG